MREEVNLLMALALGREKGITEWGGTGSFSIAVSYGSLSKWNNWIALTAGT